MINGSLGSVRFNLCVCFYYELRGSMCAFSIAFYPFHIDLTD